MTFLRALHHRPFALLWTGQTISRLGDSLYRIALAWWVLEETGSAEAMGTVLVFAFAPMLFFLLIGGVVVDRLPRLRVMFAADLVNGAVVGLLALLAAAGRLRVEHVYAASAVFGLAEAFFFPAYTASIPQLVPPESLPSANSLTSLSWQLSGVVGPALGAGVVAAAGAPAAFALDAASFFVSAMFLVPILRLLAAPRGNGAKPSGLADMRQGLSLVRSTPWLWVSIGVFAFINLTDAGPRNVALPFLVHDRLGLEVDALGLVSGITAAGSVLSAIYLGRKQRLRRRGLLAYGGVIVGGLMLMVYGMAPSIVWLAAAAVIYGMAFSATGLVWTNTLQAMVPAEALGRVSSIDALGSFVLLPLGFYVAGVLTDRYGASLTFLLGGAATIFLALLALSHPDVRRLD
jgi:DHA3 family tetracycline resistance protein-like MFS transporter